MTATATKIDTRHTTNVAIGFGNRAAYLAGMVEPAYEAINEARRALSAAERAYEDAKAEAETAKRAPVELARALAWPLGIVEEPERAEYGDRSRHYRTPFAHGRVVVGKSYRLKTPKGRSHGWINDSTDARTAFDFEPPAGTNDPAKLEAQRAHADRVLREWLAGYTAERWLRDHGINPATRPPLEAVASLAVEVRGRTDYHGGELVRWYRPVWSLTLGGATVATIDDPRELYTDDERKTYPGGYEAYKAQDDILGRIPSDDEEATRAWALGHAERARAALVRSLGYQPERY